MQSPVTLSVEPSQDEPALVLGVGEFVDPLQHAAENGDPLVEQIGTEAHDDAMRELYGMTWAELQERQKLTGLPVDALVEIRRVTDAEFTARQALVPEPPPADMPWLNLDFTQELPVSPDSEADWAREVHRMARFHERHGVLMFAEAALHESEPNHPALANLKALVQAHGALGQNYVNETAREHLERVVDQAQRERFQAAEQIRLDRERDERKNVAGWERYHDAQAQVDAARRRGVDESTIIARQRMGQLPTPRRPKGQPPQAHPQRIMR